MKTVTRLLSVSIVLASFETFSFGQTVDSPQVWVQNVPRGQAASDTTMFRRMIQHNGNWNLIYYHQKSSDAATDAWSPYVKNLDTDEVTNAPLWVGVRLAQEAIHRGQSIGAHGTTATNPTDATLGILLQRVGIPVNSSRCIGSGTAPGGLGSSGVFFSGASDVQFGSIHGCSQPDPNGAVGGGTPNHPDLYADNRDIKIIYRNRRTASNCSAGSGDARVCRAAMFRTGAWH